MMKRMIPAPKMKAPTTMKDHPAKADTGEVKK